MRITGFSLRNPLIVIAITVALLLAGLTAYFAMGVATVPNITFPGAMVTTTDLGADPATVETQITKPLEDAIATLPNVDTIDSTSSNGVSIISVQFTTNANPDLVPVDVERVVNSVRNQLPSEADPPSIAKFDTSATPVITVAVSGPQSLEEMSTLAKDRIERAFAAVPGVQSVRVSGSVTREVQVQVDPQKLEAYGIGMNTVQLALQSEHVQLPASQLVADSRDTNVVLDGLVTQPDQLGKIIVANTPNGPVYLSDVATISNGMILFWLK
jgi:hydrophobic/amphiphilic exporter-1 (mainly G- bacteria), HAE1 family